MTELMKVEQISTNLDIDGQKFTRLAKAIQYMVVGGRQVSLQQAQATALVALALNLNPFAGEVYPLPNGPYVGLKGKRRNAKNQVGTGGYMMEPIRVDPADYDYPEDAVVFIQKLRVTEDIQNWMQLRSMLREAGEDPETIKEVVGPAPIYIGIGAAYPAEIEDFNNQRHRQTKRTPSRLAMERAEKHALDQRFPMGMKVDDGLDPDLDLHQDMMNEDAIDVDAKEVQDPANQIDYVKLVDFLEWDSTTATHDPRRKPEVYFNAYADGHQLGIMEKEAVLEAAGYNYQRALATLFLDHLGDTPIPDVVMKNAGDHLKDLGY